MNVYHHPSYDSQPGDSATRRGWRTLEDRWLDAAEAVVDARIAYDEAREGPTRLHDREECKRTDADLRAAYGAQREAAKELTEAGWEVPTARLARRMAGRAARS